MAAINLAKKILRVALFKSSKHMDFSLLSNKIIYASVKHYIENDVISKMPLSRFKAILKKVRNRTLEDLKHLKWAAKSSDSYQSNLDVISTLGFILDNDQFFYRIETYVKEDNYDLFDAIHEAFNEIDNTLDQYHRNPNDKVFLLILMEQVSYIEDRLCSHARRFLFEEFTKTLDTDKIIVVQSFFREIFSSFNSNIKGIIYRNTSEDQAIAHFSVNFQVPIIHSNVELLGRKKVILLTNTQEIIIEPKKELIQSYNLQNQSKEIIHTIDPSILGDRYRLYATISNPSDISMVVDNFWYDGVMFKPEYLLAANGSPLTTDEWIEYIKIIEQNNNQRSIVFRFPAFDKIVSTDDFNGEYPNKNSMYHQHSYYVNYLSAIAHVMKDSMSEISFHIPFIRVEKDMHEWTSFIKRVMKQNEYIKEFQLGFDLDYQSTIQSNKELRASKNMIFHLDSIVMDYIDNFRSYYDALSLRLFKDSHAYADVIDTFQYFRRHYATVKPFFMGHYITSNEMFNRLLRAGYRNFGIHPSVLHQLVPLIKTRIDNKGRYNGFHKFNQERRLFYQQLREKLGPDAVIKQGAYKEYLEEQKEKKNK